MKWAIVLILSFTALSATAGLQEIEKRAFLVGGLTLKLPANPKLNSRIAAFRLMIAGTIDQTVKLCQQHLKGEGSQCRGAIEYFALVNEGLGLEAGLPSEGNLPEDANAQRVKAKNLIVKSCSADANT